MPPPPVQSKEIEHFPMSNQHATLNFENFLYKIVKDGTDTNTVLYSHSL